VTASRVIRLGVVLVPLLAAATVTASAPARNRSEVSLPTLEHQLVDAVNVFRVAHHRDRLRLSSSLNSSARQHSLQMGRLGYFSHSSANGTPFWRRIEHYYSAHDYSYWAAGENLLWAARGVTAGRALRMWIVSPEHRLNLLSRQWRQFGVSAVQVWHAPGVFDGRNVTIITADFGVRR